MRTMISIYRQLGQYIDTMDTEARARGEAEDTTIDAHFRSGVYLGVGMSNIILSLMPAKLQTIVELFGYKGDRQLGLQSLMKAGGWSTDKNEPSVCTSAFPPFFLISPINTHADTPPIVPVSLPPPLLHGHSTILV